MKKIQIIMALGLIIILASCTHTNNLSQFNLNGQKVFFDNIASARGSATRIYYNEKFDEGKDEKQQLIEFVATAVGKAILSSETEKKLLAAVDAGELAEKISDGMESSMVKYLMIRPSKSLDAETRFICTTRLRECNIVSSPAGVYVYAKATCEITDRSTGSIVWDNTETERFYIRRSVAGAVGEINENAGKIAQSIELISVSTEQIKENVHGAASELGYEMAGQLREDIAAAYAEK